MACVLVPAAEAVLTTAAEKILAAKEEKHPAEFRANFSRKLKWLNRLLWGGSGLLAFEHVWHGEITPWFPFLTAAWNPADAAEMLHEMATAGVGMAALCTAVWVIMLVVSSKIEKRAELPASE